MPRERLSARGPSLQERAYAIRDLVMLPRRQICGPIQGAIR